MTIPTEEVRKAIDAIDKIGKLKLDSRLYAFHLEDSWHYEQEGVGDGYELFLRHGNTLKNYIRQYQLPKEKLIINLKKEKFNKIYTGNIFIETGFLGINYESIDENDGHSMKYTILEDKEIEQFEKNGIKVITLDSLI